MAKARGLDARLERLRALRQEPASPEHVAELRKALADKSNLVAAEAAEIVGARLLAELTPDLVAAFDRFMVDPAETDKLCRAKLAIVETLNKLEYDQEAIFLTAIRHVQMEPRWGTSEDAAADLRGSAAFGLVRLNYRDVVLLLVDLLLDREKVARMAAAQALGETRAPAAIPLLRYKARLGDKDSEVTAECLAALMVAAPVESLPFVTRFLNSADEALQQGAAFALAESRRADALAVLKDHYAKARRSSLQEVLLLAISMTRLPAGLEFVFEVLAGDDRTAAQAALAALAIHRHNDSVHERVAALVAQKQDTALQERFRKKFSKGR
ncbi:MAG: HEAT repeat domain-containing protein [Planctomycetia bacterium]|nr:HEAT repeat domain-containing protein [Planctomycetia bacterium]